jgi:outer membrane lipoprotein SlyB
MNLVPKLSAIVMIAWAAVAQAGEIDGRAVIGGAVGGGAGAAVGSAVGGREGAIIGGGLGGAAGAAIATQPRKTEEVKVEKQVVVEKEVVYVHDHDDHCWPPGHCKHKHKHKHRH